MLRDVPPPPPPGANRALATASSAGMEDDGGVPMVRIKQPERVYDREAVLGRDASSVFPSLAQENADKVVSATQAVVGAMSFVTETELEEIKARRGGALRPEDGTMEPEKSLWAVLQEVGTRNRVSPSFSVFPRPGKKTSEIWLDPSRRGFDDDDARRIRVRFPR